MKDFVYILIDWIIVRCMILPAFELNESLPSSLLSFSTKVTKFYAFVLLFFFLTKASTFGSIGEANWFFLTPESESNHVITFGINIDFVLSWTKSIHLCATVLIVMENWVSVYCNMQILRITYFWGKVTNLSCLIAAKLRIWR